jgi:hypothetical protein
LKLGGVLEFGFSLRSRKRAPQRLVVDYRIDYMKSNGRRAPKVFKLRETTLTGDGVLKFVKRQTIRDFSTRKHYPGGHRVEVLVNGQSMGGGEFRLVL